MVLATKEVKGEIEYVAEWATWYNLFNLNAYILTKTPVKSSSI